MNKKLFLYSCLLLPFLSHSQIVKVWTNAVQPAVSILHMEPAQPVEGKNLLVFFRFTNSNPNGTTLNGWIGADINSGTGYPGHSTGDWEVINLAPNAYVDGAVWMKTPDAGMNRLVRVYFYQEQHINGNQVVKSPPLYTIGEQNIHIAAELQFSLESFKINHTRARSTDTDYGSLYVVRDGQPVMKPTAIYLGNFEDGTFPFQAANTNSDPNVLSTKKLTTEPFTIVPQQNSTIAISYFMINVGAIEDQKDFLERMATATANPEVFKVSHGSSALLTFARVLNPFFYILGACDGLVVAERKDIQTNEFYYNQYGNADFTERYNSEVFASQAGCGNTSDYEVNSKMKKISAPLDGRYNYSPGLKVHQNSKIDIEKLKMAYFTWERMETIAADGSFITTNDAATYGFMTGTIFHAPAEVSSSKLVIMRGHRPRFLKGVDPLTAENDMSTEPVTLVIQLLPGAQQMNPKIYTDMTVPTSGKEKQPSPPPTGTESKPTLMKVRPKGNQ